MTAINSAAVVARLLEAEGFNDHVAGVVERYFKREGNLTDRQRRSIERMEKEIAEWTKDMPASKRLLLGKFIGLHKKMAFDSGLRIGLTCMAQRGGAV